MKNLQLIFAFLLVTLLGAFAFAQVIVEPTQAEWGAWFADLLSGKSGLALGLVAVQGIMLAFKSKLGEKAGKWRYFAVALISLVAAAGAVLVVPGKTWADVFADGAVVAAFSVFLHQALVQFGTQQGNEVQKSA